MMMISTTMSMMKMTTMIDSERSRAPRSSRSDQRNARHLAREFALQGIYSWLLQEDPIQAEQSLPAPESESAAETMPDLARDLQDIDDHLRASDDFGRADQQWYHGLLTGVLHRAGTLRTCFMPYVDRPLHELSPVEHAILLLATLELSEHPEVPYRVVINEAVELAKTFGGTDGYRFINGVLDKLAAEIRKEEFGRPAKTDRNARRRGPASGKGTPSDA